MAFSIIENRDIFLPDGTTLPPFIVNDENGNPVFYGVTEQQCQEWIDSNVN